MVYAHIVGGSIVELFTPPNGIDISQCFHSALTWVDITGRSPLPQVGWTATQSNGIWVMAPTVTPAPTPAQQAQDILGTGVQIVSISQPTLNGTYSLDAESRMDIMAEMISLGVNRTFTDGSIVLDLLDSFANPHAFDADHFKSFATAIGNFVTTLKIIIAGKASEIPPQPLRIM